MLLPTLAPTTGCRTCKSTDHLPAAVAPSPPPPTFSQYHLAGFDWGGVARVLVLPINNESAYTRAGVEVRHALCAELQRLGRFEVVCPPPDYPGCLAEMIHNNGRFDEAAMLELAHVFGADVVVHATITQYSPYSRPVLGLVVQAVSPFEAKVVAGVDGLWDGGNPNTSNRARDFYRSPSFSRFPRLAAVGLLPPQFDEDHAEDLALDSPVLFQRFVCNEVAQNLVTMPRAPSRPEPEPLPTPSATPTPAPEMQIIPRDPPKTPPIRPE